MLDSVVSHPGGELYPIEHLDPSRSDDIAAFIAGVDERLRAARFHRYMTPDMVRNHYRALRWDDAVIAAWVVGGIIYGVCEGHLFQGPEGLEAEVALCVDEDPYGRTIGQVLLQSVISSMADRGVWRSVMILSSVDRVHADIVRQLDGVVDWERGMAILLPG